MVNKKEEIKSILKEIIKKGPYFIPCSTRDDWNKPVSIDKVELLRVLDNLNYSLEFEESYIDDYIYTVLIIIEDNEVPIEFNNLDYRTYEGKAISPGYDDFSEKQHLAIYLNKESFDSIIK